MSFRTKSQTPPSRAAFFSLILFSFILILFSGLEARAEQVTLAWDPNTEADLAGYKVYLGTSTGAYHTVMDIGNHPGVTVTNLSLGLTYFFSVTAYDHLGNESEFSNEVIKAVVKQYQVNVRKRGSGLGTVVGDGINCGADCQGVYDEGTEVRLSVNTEPGSQFTGWAGDDCSGVGECVLTLWADKSLTAGLLNSNSVSKKKQSLADRTKLRGPRALDSGSGVRRLSGSEASLPQAEPTPSYYLIVKKTDSQRNASK